MGRAEEGKHVLMLTQYFAPDIAGGAFRMATLYRYLLDAGYKVDMITAVPHKGSVEEVAADVHVHRVRVSPAVPRSKLAYGWHYLSFFWRSLWLALRSRAFGADVIFASTPPIFVAVEAVWIGALLHRSLLLDVRDLWPDSVVDAGKLKAGSLLYRFLRLVERSCYHRATRVFTVSQPMRQHVLDSGATAVDVVYNGVCRAEILGAAEVAPRRWKSGDVVQVFYTGNLGLLQDFEFLVEALPELGERYGDKLQVHLVGTGARASEYRKAAASARPGLLTVHELMPRSALLTMLRDEATFMLVSLSDGTSLAKTIPSKVFECLLLQKPTLYHLNGEGDTILREVGCAVRFELTSGDFLRALVEAVERLPELEEAAETKSLAVLGRFVREDHYQRIAAAIDAASHH